MEQGVPGDTLQFELAHPDTGHSLMIFDLVNDFADVLSAMPEGHPRRRILKLLDEAIRRDVHFIDRHPTTLFQCLWNTCWWYDSPEAVAHYQPVPMLRDIIARQVVDDAAREEINEVKLTEFLRLAGRERSASPGPYSIAVGHNTNSSGALSTLLDEWRGRKESSTPEFVWIRSRRPPDLPLGEGQQLRLTGHPSSVTTVAWSRDGRRIGCGCETGEIRVWDAETGALISESLAHAGRVVALSFSSDGRLIASAGDDSTVRVGRSDHGNQHFRIDHGQDPASVLSFSPCEPRFVSGDSKGHVNVWDAETGALVYRLKLEIDAARLDAGIQQIEFSPDGDTVAAANRYWVGLWGTSTGQLHDVCRFDPQGSDAFTFTADGSCLISISRKDCPEIQVQRIAGDQRDRGEVRRWTIERMTASAPVCLATKPDSHELIVGVNDNVVQVWDWKDGTRPEITVCTPYRMSTMTVSNDGGRFAWSAGRTVSVWRITQAAEPRRTPAHGYEAYSVGFLSSGDHVVTSGDDYGSGDAGFGLGPAMEIDRIWDIESGLCALEYCSASLDAPRFKHMPRSATEWVVKGGDRETTVYSGKSPHAVAWYPEIFRDVAVHLTLPVVAASSRSSDAFTLLSIEPAGALCHLPDVRHHEQTREQALTMPRPESALALPEIQPSAIYHGIIDQFPTLDRNSAVPWGVPLGKVIHGPFLPCIDHPDYEFFARNEPRAAVSGDFFGVVKCGVTQRAIIVADAAGWGPKASEAMALAVPTLLSSIRQHPDSPGNALENTDAQLLDDLGKSGQFICLALAILDTETGNVRIANSGHHSSLLVHSDGTVVDIETVVGLPLGFGGPPVPETERVLMPGQRIVLFTDGINERMDAEGRVYTLERLRVQLSKAQGTAVDVAGSVLGDVFAHAGSHPPDDDWTFVMFGRRPRMPDTDARKVTR